VSAKRTSSKRSVTSKASPREVPALFIDRDAWSLKLGRALEDAGIGHVAHHQQFDSESPDTAWIEAAGKHGWIAITRDQNIRRKPNELAAIRASRAIIFVFTSGNLSAEDTARILLQALPRVYRLATGAKRPQLFSIRRDGSIGRLKL
jgi:predicted nuclease of predicted toxin-antitoxin system